MTRLNSRSACSSGDMLEMSGATPCDPPEAIPLSGTPGCVPAAGLRDPADQTDSRISATMAKPGIPQRSRVDARGSGAPACGAEAGRAGECAIGIASVPARTGERCESPTATPHSKQKRASSRSRVPHSLQNFGREPAVAVMTFVRDCFQVPSNASRAPRPARVLQSRGRSAVRTAADSARCGEARAGSIRRTLT